MCLDLADVHAIMTFSSFLLTTVGEGGGLRTKARKYIFADIVRQSNWQYMYNYKYGQTFQEGKALLFCC